MPVLNYMDFANVKRRYPQTRRDGTLNYAFAGGSAVKLLLDADEVRGAPFKDSSIGERREHKDIEVIAFNGVFGSKNPNPHDVLGVDFYGPLQAIDYNAHYCTHGIFVEILRDYYFGFKVPTIEDTRKIINSDRRRFYTLTPEFLIASKILSTIGLREGIDDEDALRLLKRFEIDESYLEKLRKGSRFDPFVGSLHDLERRLEDGSFFSEVEKKIRERYQGAFPQVEDLPYGVAVSLVDFEPEDLILNTKQSAFLDWLKFNGCSLSDASVRESPVYQLCMRYALQHLNFHFMRSDLVKHVEQKMRWTLVETPQKEATQMEYIISNEVKDNPHRAVSIATGINKTLSLLSRGHRGSHQLYDFLAYHTALTIAKSPVLLVEVARLQRDLKEG